MILDGMTMNNVYSYSKRIATIEDLKGLEMYNPTVQAGDVIEFPAVEDFVIARQRIYSHKPDYIVLLTVLRNGKLNWIKVQTMKVDGNSEMHMTYSLRTRFCLSNSAKKTNTLKEFLQEMAGKTILVKETYDFEVL